MSTTVLVTPPTTDKLGELSPTYPGSGTAGLLLPRLISGAGEHASRRFLEFFTANIRNKNTRTAYARSVMHFLSW